MKRLFFIFFFIFVQSVLFSQVVFNRIVEDTVAHITSSVVALDTGYIFASGTRNEFGIRSFALSYVNLQGDKQWKHIYGSNGFEFWEGLENSFKRFGDSFFLTGSVMKPDTMGIFLYEFNNYFDNTLASVELCDTSWKKGFNFIMVDGSFFITGQIYNYELQKYQLSLIKLEQNGNYLWSKSYGDLYESGRQLIESKDKKIIVGGRTYSFPVSTANEKWYLIKTDTSGNVIWERAYGHNTYRNGAVNGLIETKDSCYLACGGYPAAKYGTGSGEILWDGCLRKINQDGELLWTKYLKSYILSHTGDIYFQNNIYSIVEKNENIYAVGWNYGYVSWKDRGYLAKLDKDGNLLWKREYYALDTNSYSQYLTVLQSTNDNGFILAGYGNEYDTHGYDPPQQAWLVKTDSLGLDGLSNAELPELNIDIELPETICMSDTISIYAYIAGKSAPYTIEISTGQVIDSIFYPPTFVPVEIGLTHVDLQWGGSTYFEQTITEATLTNHAWGQCIAKPVEVYTPTTAGLQEIYITVTDAYGESKTITKEVTVIDCGVESILQNQNSGYKIYPNPAKDRVFVNILAYENASYIEILNSAGQVVLTENVTSEETEINIKELATGSYVVRVYCGNKIENLRFEKL